MEFSVKSGSPEKQRTACLVVGVYESRRLSPAARSLDKAAGGYLKNVLKRGDMDGRCGQTLLLHDVPGTACQRLLLVGCGQERELDTTKYRNAVAAAAQRLNETGASDAVSYLADLHVKGRDTHWKLRQIVEATEAALYVFDQLKSEKDKVRRPLRKLALGVTDKKDAGNAQAAITEGRAIAAGVRLARELGNLPGNICTPTYLGDQARELAKGKRKVKATVLDRKDMEKLGMGALLAVARGTDEPPKLITLEYQGGKKGDKPVVLVGKGVTFDTGGISLKPGAAMDEMKFDMCGAASVLGTLAAVIRMELPLNVIGVIPATDNMPSGKAIKPGDIVTSLSGQTIEILNTDAEGRLILCDALTYAERFEPDAVIDIATLTGACVIALGSHAAGLLSNQPSLAHDLLQAGEAASDRAWQLPLWDDYQGQLDSNFADMANIGGREAGTITAACFLSRFTKKYHWAHLDIAGVAWKQGKEKGATGRPVPLLTQYLLDRVADK
ncbi:leucyl aminopeptidase [Thiohalobacter thiocyanaticus]|uniref:Probable cytosol aminopeptidase n=1 Tax=Thiohalobacter thiocyanaticus TaxID=585455 RepID=A0A1Z4VTZ8_9GAMM|nr:leucyl aminopeptidase [Thiohalobacter thiocyanaticus]BAZ94955.1 leucyl aminopeptidase [Thiohalobacter thiocyanaticus]